MNIMLDEMLNATTADMMPDTMPAMQAKPSYAARIPGHDARHAGQAELRAARIPGHDARHAGQAELRAVCVVAVM